MSLLRYVKWDPEKHGDQKSTFETLMDLFQQLLEFTAGDASEALKWLSQLDEKYSITDEEFGMGDFIDELKRKGYLKEDAKGSISITAKTEKSLRSKSLELIFGELRKGNRGRHKTPHSGRGTERLPETRSWKFGDDIQNLDVTTTLNNAFKRSGHQDFNLQEEDFQVYETDHNSSMATVLMIDLSHSMILYGEDRITPARRTAMALSELVMTRYPGDTLDIVAFGDDAWEVQVKDLPYLQVGPYHTNTRAGLERARTILHRRKNANKQIFMITDGKPSAHFLADGRFYKNSFGLDRQIVNKVLDEAVVCRREGITITTFMLASDPYLQSFVRRLTESNRGRAYYSGINRLGEFLFEDYQKNRRRSLR